MTINHNEEWCAYRLPCGICTRTNQMCPKCGVTVTPTWVSTAGGTASNVTATNNQKLKENKND